MAERKLHYCASKDNGEYYMIAVGKHNLLSEVTTSLRESGLCIAAADLHTDPPAMVVGGFSMDDLGTLLRSEGANVISFRKAIERGVVYFEPPELMDSRTHTSATKEYRGLNEQEIKQLKFHIH